jgi:signal transduction histidine kinase/ActR/RegA family two-component response regulator
MRRHGVASRRAALALLALAWSSTAHAEGLKKVLILNSYHQGYEWTDDQTRGALAALGAPTKDIEIHIEYMGTKWVSDRHYFEQLRQAYSLKFSKLRFDVIIATDNDAFDFLRAHRDGVFGRVPVVFSGVNHLAPEELAGHDLFTGVNEVADFRSGLDLALRLHPGTRRVAVITDTSISGRKIKAQFMEVAPEYEARIRFEYLDDLEMGELLARVASLPADALVFHLLYFNDGTGKVFTNGESGSLVSGAARVPVYGSWDFNLGYGIVGGKLLHGLGQGRLAGGMALRLLHGERIQDIPVVMESPSRFMFDHRQLQRFGLRRSDLPEGSILIDEPPSFYALNKGLVWGGVSGMAGLAGMVALLLRIIAQRRRAEHALRENEARYRAIVDGFDGLIHICSADRRLVFANRKLADRIGRDARGEACHQALFGRSAPCDECAMARVLDGQNVRREVHDPADGRWYYVIDTPLVHADGAVSKQSVLLDITDRRRAEEALKEREAEILRAQKLESVALLAGGIAHDFNNLLTAILGNISMAKELASPEAELLEPLADAQTASLRARDLTHRLLTFARGGAPVKKSISVAELVTTCARLASSGSKAACQLDLPGDLWPIDADEVQMGQVLTNLILNADQAMPAGGSITVRCRNVLPGASPAPPDARGRYVEIVVRDEGIGIRAEDLGKVFDPFFTTKEKGRGLGLSTAYSIVKHHGGSISVDSSPGAGSTFTLHLPASRSPATARPADGRDVRRGQGRILVMDDEEAVRRALQRMLAHLGYEVECASDGAEAAELYARAMRAGKRFHAVVMDLTIPGGMGGKEAVRRLLELDPQVKAVVSSGYSSDPIMSDYRSFGFAGVVGKPYELAEVAEALDRIVAGAD